MWILDRTGPKLDSLIIPWLSEIEKWTVKLPRIVLLSSQVVRSKWDGFLAYIFRRTRSSSSITFLTREIYS